MENVKGRQQKKKQKNCLIANLVTILSMFTAWSKFVVVRQHKSDIQSGLSFTVSPSK